jgi:hypothetical protein
MIGGSDIILRVRDAETAMDLAIRVTVRLWGRPIFEDADSGETFDEYQKLVLTGRREILIYRDSAAQAGWKALGADESLDGTMIHLIAAAGELTIAVDDVPNPSIRSFVAAVRNALQNDLFASSAEGLRKVAA